MEVDYAKSVLRLVVVVVLSCVVAMLNLLLNVIHVAFPIVLSAWPRVPKILVSGVVIALPNVWSS